MALNGLFCADVPLRNYSLTHSARTVPMSHRDKPLSSNSGQDASPNFTRSNFIIIYISCAIPNYYTVAIVAVAFAA